MKRISKDALIGDLVKKYPESAAVLLKHGMHCIGCHVATWETLEQACQSHGINADKIIEELNKVAK